MTSVRCADGKGEVRKNLCCPLDGAPDPDFCAWRDGGKVNGFLGCNAQSLKPCQQDEVEIVRDNYYINSGGGDESCVNIGKASYCCKKEETGEKLCGWSPDCVDLVNGRPKEGMSVCDQGQQFVTYRDGNCRGRGKYQPFCCSSGVDIGKLACHWNQPDMGNCKPGRCGQSEVDLGEHGGGGGAGDTTHQCLSLPPWDCGICEAPSTIAGPTLCCNKEALKVKVKTLPVPLENLFFADDLKKLPPGSEPKFAIQTDNTMGGQRKDGGDSDPNRNGFAWHIIDGPAKEFQNIDKRDGSHWEVYDCDPVHHEEVQTAKMVCTDDSAESNCHAIWLDGVPTTVLKMPKGCGPGKYAVAVSLEQMGGDERPPPHINIRNVRRGVRNPPVYKLTFDYDFSVLQRRAESNTLLRIDYSDNPGYWAEIVCKSLLTASYPISTIAIHVTLTTIHSQRLPQDTPRDLSATSSTRCTRSTTATGTPSWTTTGTCSGATRRTTSCTSCTLAGSASRSTTGSSACGTSSSSTRRCGTRSTTCLPYLCSTRRVSASSDPV